MCRGHIELKQPRPIAWRRKGEGKCFVAGEEVQAESRVRWRALPALLRASSARTSIPVRRLNNN